MRNSNPIDPTGALTGKDFAIAVRNDNLRKQLADARATIGRYERSRNENEAWHAAYERCYWTLDAIAKRLHEATGEVITIPEYIPRQSANVGRVIGAK